jgi:hypothetical protein
VLVLIRVGVVFLWIWIWVGGVRAFGRLWGWVGVGGRAAAVLGGGVALGARPEAGGAQRTIHPRQDEKEA